MHCLLDLIRMSDEKLGGVDPLEMNLVVASGIPSLAHLNTAEYQREADRWAAAIRTK